MPKRRKPLVEYPKYVPAEGGTHYVHGDYRDTPHNKMMQSLFHEKRVRRFKALKEAADRKALTRLKRERGVKD